MTLVLLGGNYMQVYHRPGLNPNHTSQTHTSIYLCLANNFNVFSRTSDTFELSNVIEATGNDKK